MYVGDSGTINDRKCVSKESSTLCFERAYALGSCLLWVTFRVKGYQKGYQNSLCTVMNSNNFEMVCENSSQNPAGEFFQGIET